MAHTNKKIVVTINVGAKESETTGGNDAGNLIVKFFFDKIEYNLVIPIATIIPTKIPCPPK